LVDVLYEAFMVEIRPTGGTGFEFVLFTKLCHAFRDIEYRGGFRLRALPSRNFTDDGFPGGTSQRAFQTLLQLSVCLLGAGDESLGPARLLNTRF
jgi:hypothetical protein